jgi:hypothetical protein
MISIPQYHPVTPDYTNQVGIAQQQEEQDEEKKVAVQDSKESSKLQFERERNSEEKQKKKQGPRQEAPRAVGEEDSPSQRHRLLHVIA